MPQRRPESSSQTRAVLRALQRDSSNWHYGYDIARMTALSSGTLYPMLARLADRGLLEARWEQDAPEGRPRRHLYRLSTAGAALAASLPAEAPDKTRRWSAQPASQEG